MHSYKPNWFTEITILSKPNNRKVQDHKFHILISTLTLQYRFGWFKFKVKKYLTHKIDQSLGDKVCEHQQLLLPGIKCLLCQHHSTHNTIFDTMFFFKKGFYLQTYPNKWYRLIEVTKDGVTVTQLPFRRSSMNFIHDQVRDKSLLPITNEFIPRQKLSQKGVKELLVG